MIIVVCSDRGWFCYTRCRRAVCRFGRESQTDDREENENESIIEMRSEMSYLNDLMETRECVYSSLELE